MPTPWRVPFEHAQPRAVYRREAGGYEDEFGIWHAGELDPHFIARPDYGVYWEESVPFNALVGTSLIEGMPYSRAAVQAEQRERIDSWGYPGTWTENPAWWTAQFGPVQGQILGSFGASYWLLQVQQGLGPLAEPILPDAPPAGSVARPEIRSYP